MKQVFVLGAAMALTLSCANESGVRQNAHESPLSSELTASQDPFCRFLPARNGTVRGADSTLSCRWIAADSAAWLLLQDSIRSAVDARGGTPLPCESIQDATPQTRAMQHWRIDEHFARLLAYRWTRYNSPNREWQLVPWMVQFDLSTHPPLECSSGS